MEVENCDEQIVAGRVHKKFSLEFKLEVLWQGKYRIRPKRDFEPYVICERQREQVIVSIYKHLAGKQAKGVILVV